MASVSTLIGFAMYPGKLTVKVRLMSTANADSTAIMSFAVLAVCIRLFLRRSLRF